MFLSTLLVSCLNKNLTKLDAPVINENNGVIYWEQIDNASNYTIYIDGSEEILVDAQTTSYELSNVSDGIHKIKVKAMGDNEKYSNSNFSNIITYNTGKTEKTKLETPVIRALTLSIIWDSIPNALEYEIYINDVLVDTTANSYYSLERYEDETISVKIRAIGNSLKYFNSDFSEVLTHKFSQDLMKISEIKAKLDENVENGIAVRFVGKVIGFDSMGYAHVADETGAIYVRYICNELKLGENVLIKGRAIIYRGSGKYAEYTRQVEAKNISVKSYNKEIQTIDFMELSSEDLKNKNVSASFHGNPVIITGTVECGSDRYSFYLNDELGNHLVSIHHYSTNFNNNITNEYVNSFLSLNNKIVTLKGIIYRYYESDNVWTLQCVGFDNQIKTLGIRLPAPEITKNEEKIEWIQESKMDITYNVYVNNVLYTTTQNTSFDLSTLGEGSFKVQVQAVSTVPDLYQPSYLSNTIVYIKSDLVQNVNIFMINDTHGSFVDTNYPGIERVSTLLKELTSLNGDYIKIMNGDAFQGSYVSNVLYGLPLVDAFNQMEFDAFVIGNHEFDWGLEEIHKYKDGDYSNGEADFPFLGANIYDKKTNKMVEWLDPYTVVEQNGLKVGIIGIIGHNLESSILSEHIENYEFIYPIEIIKKYAKELREQMGCNIVIVANHDYDEEINLEIAGLENEYRIDAILCGHTHQNEYEDLVRSDNLNIATIENRDKNQSASSLILKLDENLNYESYQYNRYYPSNYSFDSEMTMLITKYQDTIDEGNRVVGYTSQVISKSTLGMYAVSTMKEEYNTDVAIMNTGGIRATISRGSITVSSVFEVLPFNNKVIITTMSGSALKSLYENNSSYLYFNSEFNVNNLVLNQNYKVAVIDYVYTGTYYTEFKNTIPEKTNVLLRDLLLEYIENKY